MSVRPCLIIRDTGCPICPHCGYARKETFNCKRPGKHTVLCPHPDCRLPYVVRAYPVMRYDTEPVGEVKRT